MDTLQEKEEMRDLPFRDDGTIDLGEMMRRELEAWPTESRTDKL